MTRRMAGSRRLTMSTMSPVRCSQSGWSNWSTVRPPWWISTTNTFTPCWRSSGSTRLMESASSAKRSPAMPEASDMSAVSLSTAPMKAIFTPWTSWMLRRQEGFVGDHVDHVGGQVAELSAAESGLQLAGLFRSRRRAAALLLAQQLLPAAVKFVVADRADTQAEAVHRAYRRLVGPHRRYRRTAADQIAGADQQQLRVFLAPRLQRRAQRLDAAGDDDVFPLVAVGVSEVARLQIAVEVVDGDEVDVGDAGLMRRRAGAQCQRCGDGDGAPPLRPCR